MQKVTGTSSYVLEGWGVANEELMGQNNIKDYLTGL